MAKVKDTKIEKIDHSGRWVDGVFHTHVAPKPKVKVSKPVSKPKRDDNDPLLRLE